MSKLSDWVDRRTFEVIHHNNLVYNTCWEDPRLDRAALDLGPGDTVLVLTSAGCNVLDYALCAPRRIHAVDVNPRQNALLALKLAGIRRLDFERFFAMFGRGHLPEVREVYRDALRDELDDWSRAGGTAGSGSSRTPGGPSSSGARRGPSRGP